MTKVSHSLPEVLALILPVGCYRPDLVIIWEHIVPDLINQLKGVQFLPVALHAEGKSLHAAVAQ